MDAFVSDPIVHNHASNSDRIPVIQLHNQVKQSATTIDQSSSSILNSALTTCPIYAVGKLPKNENFVQTIRRQRTKTTVKSNGFLTEDLKKTYRGEQFLLYEDNETIMLTTKGNLSILKQCKHYFVGRTFKVNSQLSNTHS